MATRALPPILAGLLVLLAGCAAPADGGLQLLSPAGAAAVVPSASTAASSFQDGQIHLTLCQTLTGGIPSGW